MLLAQLPVSKHAAGGVSSKFVKAIIQNTLDMECYAGAIGSLLEFDPTDISLPLAEIRKSIHQRDEVYGLSPRIFEEVVAGVFRDLGWSCRVTAYSGDGGIDVILDGPAGATVGVRFKRYEKEEDRGRANPIIGRRSDP